ncbi:RPA12 polymerase, partial [Polypterus senegalus]|nr:DNA-directed RNA polymerase I subunit RPA12 [Polypterus senegalus]XP_039624639.1 DNA-directed RNA polymerase I subunit RPA12 [Polypterus senegalus]XP_039624640.1 DNA-directed RNA polymerase I subunit RPA12 [Polypterus senegalus]MBN3294111.1 RPA12 polymerase [Polypterus senegalus]
MNTGSAFQGVADFCPECGTVLPLPGFENVVKCPRCQFSIDVREFESFTVKSSFTFNSLEASSVSAEIVGGEELKGPVTDRKCARCGNEGMVYHTRQMRSADEGQTVFFTCTRCRYQEKEDS